MSRSRSASSKVALRRTGTTPRRGRGQGAQEKIRRGGQAEQDAIALTHAPLVECARHPSLQVFGGTRVECLDTCGSGAHGAARLTPISTGGASAFSSAAKRWPRQSLIPTMTAKSATPDAHVTARMPTTWAIAPWTTAPIG